MEGIRRTGPQETVGNVQVGCIRALQLGMEVAVEQRTYLAMTTLGAIQNSMFWLRPCPPAREGISGFRLEIGKK